MSVNKARNNYIGQSGTRMNCAQAVIHAFKDTYDIGDDIVDRFRAFGGGNAPDGMCGAFYAVKYIMEHGSIKDYEAFERYFLEQAGSTKCRDIKEAKRLSCVGCVEKSAGFLTKANLESNV